MIKVLLALSLLAPVHDWYPDECCHSTHCRPVPCESISEDAQGMTWHGLHFTGPQIRASPNKDCHSCTSWGWKSQTEKYYFNPLCIFIHPST